MSVHLRNIVKFSSPFHGKTREIHLELADLANEKHEWEIWASEDRLAAACDCSVKTVQRALPMLIEAGVIARERRGKYRYLVPESIQQTLDLKVANTTSRPRNTTSAETKPDIGGAQTGHLVPVYKENLKETSKETSTSSAPLAAVTTESGSTDEEEEDLDQRKRRLAELKASLAERWQANG